MLSTGLCDASQDSAQQNCVALWTKEKNQCQLFEWECQSVIGRKKGFQLFFSLLKHFINSFWLPYCNPSVELFELECHECY